MRFQFRLALAALAAIVFSTPVFAQSQFPPPAGPVTICGTQAAPAATSYQLVFDGGAPEAVTLTSPAAAACSAVSGATHSFTLPASRFTVGTHTIRVVATNAFGTTTGPAYTVTVGVAPGPFTVGGVIALANPTGLQPLLFDGLRPEPVIRIERIGE